MVSGAASHRERPEGEDQRKTEGHAHFRDADEGQRGEEHHGALGEVEHAGGLVDQHVAKRHQRIHHAGEQAADENFEEELHLR